jgi:AcrR family transcriptional regulator
MPRHFDPDEQQRVRAALIQGGRDRFTRHGLAKVTVGELAEAAGIGKGTFYLFFDSKEALFFAVQEEEEALFKRHFEEVLANLDGGGEVLLERFFALQLELLERHPFLHHLVDPGTMRTLQRKVPPEVLAAHQDRDRQWIEGLVNRWKSAGLLPPELDPELVYALSGSSFLLSTQRELVGPRWPDVAATLARALARELSGAR